VSNLPREVQAYEQQFTDVLTRLDAIKHDLSELKEPHDDLMAKTTELHHAFWDIRARAASDVQSILSRQMKHLQTISGKIVQLESSARHEREKAIEIATRDTRRHVKEWLSRADLGQLNMKLTKKRSVDRRILALEKKQSQELAALDVAFAGAP
jgi:hypothetical protein